MKILGIRIKNLASLEGFTEIDFTQEPLSSAGIFAITGPTGAGKSTILDALCLALYGKTPRYKQGQEAGIDIRDVQGTTINQGDHRGILRDGTGEGFAEVDFIGTDAQTYTATWKVRRARDKAEGALQADSIQLTNKLSGVIFPGKKKETADEIERLVGLNFEQFTRSVLLAQGDFTAFLKAAKDEKSALLEKLTGTRIYSEISKQIFVNYTKEKRDLEDLNLQREGIATLTKEELEELERQKTTIEQSIAVQEKEAEILNKEIAWHTQLTLLQNNIVAANTTQEQAIKEKQEASVREKELKQVEQVQTTRTWVDGQQAVEKQLAEKTILLQQVQSTLDILQQQHEALDRQLQTANEAALAAIQKQDQAVPLLEEARALDVQISGKTEQVNQATSEVKTVEDNYQQLEQELKAQQQQSEQLLTSIKQLQQWKQEHSPRQPIAENYLLISSKLGDAKALLDAIQSLLPQLQNTQTAIVQVRQAKTDLETKAEAITQHLKTEKEQYFKASEALAAIPISEVEKEKTSIDLCIEDVIAAEAHWKILFQSEVDLHALKQKLAGNKSELNNKTQSLARASEQLVVALAEREASHRMLDKAKLAAAESVQSLRKQLIPDEPCPVCGSQAHPYITEQPQLNHVLAQLEAAHQQNEHAYTALLKTESSLKETINRLNETIPQQEAETNTKEIALATHHKTWEAFAIYVPAAEIPDEQKATWLAQQLQDAKAKQKFLHQQIQSYAAKKQELDALQKSINDLERQENENSNSIKDTDRRLKSLQEQEAQYHKEQLSNNEALAAIEQSLTANFTAPGWFTHWKNDPAVFLQRISEFAEQWKSTIQKLDENSRQHSILTATLEATKGQLQNASVDLQKKQSALTAVKEQQDTLTQKRQALFNGEAATSVEHGLKLAVTAAQQALEKIKSELGLIQTSQTRTCTQKEQVEKDILLLQQHAKSVAQKIHEWIATFNSRNESTLDKERLLLLLAYDSNWIEKQRTELRAIDDAITKTQSVLKERTAQLQQHEQQRLSDRSAEALTELLGTVRTDLQQKVQRKNEIGFQLQQDIANKQKIGDLLGIIKAKELVTENWAKLNDIIGSADGKKFRLIAQEYTLDVLVSYANVHLGTLSNRYLLQRIPNTLGLQVIDQDMGDEVRTVYSLSGGESFLASLALALGLASLSSSRMQVESLFIDEGFGSLDPNTLNIAMDALERLHNQGRKVGVISHVQEMTERIPVQIKVSKKQSGRSKVEVVNF